MVRTIDGDARRRDLAEAVWRLLRRSGLEAASVRGVAAEAGLSTGSVRHFFGTQAELHRFALTALTDRVRERVEAAATERDVRRRVVAMVSELMPLRDETADELGVWLEYVHRSRHDPAIASAVAEQAGEVRAFLRTVVGDLRELGHLPPEADVDAGAASLNALVDGLTLELLTVPHLITRDEARRLVERHLFDQRPLGEDA